MPKLSKEQIEEMLTLYQSGEGTTLLGLKFDIDHSSVTYYIQKYHITRTMRVPYRRIDPYVRAQLMLRSKKNRQKNKKTLIDLDMEEKVNPGKSYREYLAESQERDRLNRIARAKSGFSSLSTEFRTLR